MGNHLLVAVCNQSPPPSLDYECHVRELIPLGALDDIVQDEDGAIVAGFENKDVLVFALLVVENLVDLERHGLTRPHLGNLAEPAIFCVLVSVCNWRLWRGELTLDGRVCDLGHFG